MASSRHRFARPIGLRLRLNLLLTALFITAFAINAAYLLHNARQAVIEELRASTALAYHLVDGWLNTVGTVDGVDTVVRIVERLDKQIETRHLTITLHANAGPAAGTRAHRTRDERTPAWFAELVEPNPTALTRRVRVPRVGIIVIEADPADEMVEVWRYTRAMFGVLVVAFVVITTFVYWFLGRMLQPLTRISAAMQGIERGDYAFRLPQAGLPELDVIGSRFNQMAGALERSKQDNALLAQRSLAIQEQERRHLAHELHDDMGQSITAIKALAVSIGERVDGNAAVVRSAEMITETSSEIYARVRRMMTRLHPVILDELGLTSAIELMVDDWNAHHAECFCRFRCDDDLSPLNGEAKIGLYRVVQESLTNVAKHADATEVEIDIRRQTGSAGDTVAVAIKDNGVGFDPGTTVRSLGLLGVHERVAALAGEIRVESGAGMGTALSIVVPMARQAVPGGQA